VVFLRLRDVTLDLPIYQGSSRSLKKALVATSTQGNLAKDALDRINVRALSNIALNIETGDRLGIVGANGAGKTTLLKVLAGIYEVTQGQLASSGRVSAILDASVGLNPDATGRENILLRGMYMDIRPRQMQRHAADVAEFTGLGHYLDMPVRTYSAGMMIRLAFAISTCVPPEILVMDEWLSAGDAQFLAAAHRRMVEFIRSSSILVLASHSMELLQEWCNKGIFLQHGRIVARGDIKEVIATYQQSSGATQPAAYGESGVSSAARM
jgi:ABC-type polysaccharide/polyol phosphate transport system ATPase subunit